MKLTCGQWADAFLHFLREFRAARAKVQANAEEYVAVWNVVESLGKYLKVNRYNDELKDLDATTLLLKTLFPKDIPISFERLRQARNAHVHEGAVSRTLGTHAVHLSLAIERALMKEKEANDQNVEVWMVPDPSVAQLWQTVSEIRRTLLSGGYSVLPFWWEEKKDWYFICDISVVRYLREDKGDPHSALSAVIRDGAPKKLCPVPCGDSIVRAKVSGGRIVDWHKPVESLFSEFHTDGDAAKGEAERPRGRPAGLPFPTLVVDSKCPSRLLGIITPHDLLV